MAAALRKASAFLHFHLIRIVLTSFFSKNFIHFKSSWKFQVFSKLKDIFFPLFIRKVSNMPYKDSYVLFLFMMNFYANFYKMSKISYLVKILTNMCILDKSWVRNTSLKLEKQKARARKCFQIKLVGLNLISLL